MEMESNRLQIGGRLKNHFPNLQNHYNDPPEKVLKISSKYFTSSRLSQIKTESYHLYPFSFILANDTHKYLALI